MFNFIKDVIIYCVSSPVVVTKNIFKQFKKSNNDLYEDNLQKSNITHSKWKQLYYAWKKDQTYFNEFISITKFEIEINTRGERRFLLNPDLPNDDKMFVTYSSYNTQVLLELSNQNLLALQKLEKDLQQTPFYHFENEKKALLITCVDYITVYSKYRIPQIKNHLESIQQQQKFKSQGLEEVISQKITETKDNHQQELDNIKKHYLNVLTNQQEKHENQLFEIDEKNKNLREEYENNIKNLQLMLQKQAEDNLKQVNLQSQELEKLKTDKQELNEQIITLNKLKENIEKQVSTQNVLLNQKSTEIKDFVQSISLQKETILAQAQQEIKAMESTTLKLQSENSNLRLNIQSLELAHQEQILKNNNEIINLNLIIDKAKEESTEKHKVFIQQKKIIRDLKKINADCTEEINNYKKTINTYNKDLDTYITLTSRVKFVEAYKKLNITIQATENLITKHDQIIGDTTRLINHAEEINREIIELKTSINKNENEIIKIDSQFTYNEESLPAHKSLAALADKKQDEVQETHNSNQNFLMKEKSKIQSNLDIIKQQFENKNNEYKEYLKLKDKIMNNLDRDIIDIKNNLETIKMEFNSINKAVISEMEVPNNPQKYNEKNNLFNISKLRTNLIIPNNISQQIIHPAKMNIPSLNPTNSSEISTLQVD